MSSFMADLGELSAGNIRGNAAAGVNIQKKGANMDLDMTDFLTLMIAQMTNQGIDESIDTSDMINQMVQMQMVTALANMTDASIMSYAASLVGKEVTVAQYNADGNLEELVGTVVGTGTKDGEQVIFLDNDKYYLLSEIMAVGRLPAADQTGGDDKNEDDTVTDTTPGTTTPTTPGDTTTPDAGSNTEGVGGVEDTEEGEVERDETTGRAFVPLAPIVSDTENEYHGESGVPTDSEI